MSKRPRFPARLPPLMGAVGPAPLPTQAIQFRQSAFSHLDVQPLPVMGSTDGFSSARYRLSMIEHIHQSGVNDQVVLQAMLRVERHRFIDSALRAQAYEDTSLPIGSGQTISKPNVVARMMALLREAPYCHAHTQHARVMEVGTGCGYQAAVLSLLCQEVYSIERIRELHIKAKDNLRPLRLPNVHLLLRDGVEGYESGSPFSGIISAAGAEHLPPVWVDQLCLGGRLVAPVQTQAGRQSLLVIDRTRSGFSETLLEEVQFVPLKSGIE